MTTDYSSMSKDDLLAANVELMDRRAQAQQEIEEEQIELNKALDAKIAEERILSDVADMPQAERDAMVKVLTTAPPPKEPDAEGEEMTLDDGDVEVVEVTDNG